MRTAALALGVLLAGAATPAARAEEVGRVGLGQSIGLLVADPAGGAWTTTWRTGESTYVTRHDPGRPGRRAVVKGGVRDLVLGPDGLAWGVAGADRLVRSDREGRVLEAAQLPEQRSFEGGLAFGPDGAAWSTTTVWSGDASAIELVRATTNGVVRFSPFPAPACERSRIVWTATASDGALWFADDGCSRLVRRGVDGALTITPLEALAPVKLVPDHAGGMWFLARDVVGHSGGARHPVEDVSDIAVTPDGTVWAANGSCTLQRIGGTPVPAPVAVGTLAAGGGDLWLAGGTRLFRGLDGGPCDDTGPKVTIRPKRPTLDQIRRGELRLIVREPAALEFYFEEHKFGYSKVLRKAGTWRVKPSRAVLRHLKHRRQFYFVLNATDANGIEGGTDGYIRLTTR